MNAGGGDWLHDFASQFVIPPGKHLAQATQMNASADESDRICLIAFKAIGMSTPFDGWWHAQAECNGPGPYSEPCGSNTLDKSPTPEDAAASHWGNTVTGYYGLPQPPPAPNADGNGNASKYVTLGISSGRIKQARQSVLTFRQGASLQ